jgi:hypothetical protein
LSCFKVLDDLVNEERLCLLVVADLLIDVGVLHIDLVLAYPVWVKSSLLKPCKEPDLPTFLDRVLVFLLFEPKLPNMLSLLILHLFFFILVLEERILIIL